jgi:hypothetical protein
MKNTLLLYIFIIYIGLLSSCTRKIEISNNTNTIVLDDKIKKTAIPLKGDTITSLEDNIFAYKTRVYKDSILIIRNWSSAPHLMELRRLKDNSLIKTCLIKGNGPGEVLSFQYEIYDDNSIVAYDVIKGEFSFINIDSLINYDSYKINFTKLPNSILQNVTKINDTLIFNNPFIYSNKAIDIDFTGERFIKESELEKLNEYRKKCEIFPYNVNQGFILSNNEKKRIAFFHKDYHYVRYMTQILT